MTKVLSIDGGGIKGIISAKVLMATEQALLKISGDKDKGIADYFDLVAGTSTGAILAAMLLYKEKGRHKFTAEDCLKLYLEHGGEIFKTSLLRDIYTLKGFLRPRYSSAPLAMLLDKYFGDSRLSAFHTPCLITAYDIFAKKCAFMGNGGGRKGERDYLIKDAVLCSTAAPTYFPVHRCCGGVGDIPMVDGGVFANNPAMCALAEATKLKKGVCLEKVILLSLGNAEDKSPISYGQAKAWGKLGWVPHITNIVFDGVDQTVDYQLKTIFATVKRPENYLRIAADATYGEDKIAMDDASPENLKRLCDLGDRVVEKHKSGIEKFAFRLVG